MLNPDANDTHIINLLVISLPIIEGILKSLLLDGHGECLHGKQEFFEVKTLKFLSILTSELIYKTIREQIKGVVCL